MGSMGRGPDWDTWTSRDYPEVCGVLCLDPPFSVLMQAMFAPMCLCLALDSSPLLSL